MHALIPLALYFLPTIIAVVKQNHNSVGVFLINLLLGWTGIGWFVALIMALVGSPYPRCYYQYPYPPYPPRW
jgi:hypothetical protein